MQPASGVFELDEDEPEAAWEKSAQVARIVASTRSDTRAFFRCT